MKIEIKKDRLPEFPFNSEKYNSSMPYYDEESERLYFCMNHPDGYGGWDIYYSKFDGKKWGKPVNAGDKINTPFNEIFPSIIPQGVLFASDAGIGKGGFDNYLYSFEKEECINLHGFNSADNDYCLLPFSDKSIGIKGDSLVVYNKSLDNVLNTFIMNHDELMAEI
ncbi:hypothetical protein QUH73_20825, partial [Labilibaculum sp. K2S]|nr:hypothetical protein [Labilibaculum sp. K2S]